jgi:long-chain acyl-CoA synthetase
MSSTTAPTVTTGEAIIDAPTLPAMFVRRVRAHPDELALRKKELGRWKEYTWHEYGARVTQIAAALRAIGVQPGDRVAIQSENRPAWVFADLAIQAVGAVTVGIYPTSPAAELEYLLGHSESVVFIAEDEEQYDKVMEIRDRLPALRTIVVIETRGVRFGADAGVMSWDELDARGAGATLDDLATVTAEVNPADTAIIVYTSGTTGPPKGVMLSHTNLVEAARSADQSFTTSPGDEVLSYLPLSHIAERLISVIDAVAAGYVVNFGEGGDSFLTDMQEVQPTFFVGVPRVWEKLMAAVEIRMIDASPLKRNLYRIWMKRGEALAQQRMRGGLSVTGRLQYFLGWVLVYRPLRKKLGLLRVREALSGAAPIAPRVLDWFWALGLTVREVYGQTENTAQGTIIPRDDVRIGTVGKPYHGVELKIAPDGEILTRGAGTFVGYFKDPDATRATLDEEGWLHTGDVGEIDENGFLRITDRKKDIIITAGGKNISPSEIENKLKVSPFVREAVVIGDRRKYLTALIGIEADTVSNWAAQRQLVFTTYEDLSSKPEVHDLISEWVAKVNTELAQVETIKQFRLLPKELDQESGEVTATQKVKRVAIAREFTDLIEAMYGAGEPVGATAGTATTEVAGA